MANYLRDEILKNLSILEEPLKEIYTNLNAIRAKENKVSWIISLV